MSAHPSRSILAERTATIPAALRVACATPMPTMARLSTCDRFVVSGGGLSEGPARVLVALLQRAGRRARFVAQSAFARGGMVEPSTGLISFSQGLAPNARLPHGVGLDPASALDPRLGPSLLVTAVHPRVGTGVSGLAQRLLDAGHAVWTLPPTNEDGLLLRVVGPAVALVAAIRIAAALGAVERVEASLAEVPEVVARRLAEPGLELFGGARRDLALVAGTALHELAMPLRWKLLEGLRVPDPPVWDPLQVVHGPLQAFYDAPLTLVALRTSDDGLDEIFLRLREVLHADRHRLVELVARTPDPVAIVELDAALNACLLATLAAHPLSLDDWPSRGLDGPVYDLDPDLLGERA